MTEPPSKKRRVVGNTRRPPPPVDQSQSRLLQLSDDVLLEILQLLSSHDLLTLSDTCIKLRSLCLDTASLWLDVDFTGHPMDIKTMKQTLKNFHSRTRSVTIQGFLNQRRPLKTCNLSVLILATLAQTCPNLKKLKLHKFYYSADKIQFKHFPRSLTHLSLSGCEVVHLPPDSVNEFRNFDKYFPQLEVLDLEGCGWVSNHSLMGLSRLNNLREISLKGCFHIGDCFAYTALATKHGFNKIEKFDVRDTDITDQELSCFGRKESVKELLVGGKYGDNITDRGIVNLCVDRDSKIEKLSLSGCSSITDVSLSTLAREMKHLKHLDVTQCRNITSDGLKLFESDMESRGIYCEIISD